MDHLINANVLIRVTFWLTPRYIAHTPYDVFEQALAHGCTCLLSILNDSHESFDDVCFGEHQISKLERLAAGVCYEPDYLINHLEIVALQNSVQMIDDAKFFLIYDQQIVFISVGQIGQNPCGFKL